MRKPSNQKIYKKKDDIPRVPREFTLVEIPLAAEQETGLRVMDR